MAAAVVMEAAAREWMSLEGEESFPDWLVRREVLRRDQVDALSDALAAESGGEGDAAGGGGAAGDAAARAPHPSEVIKGYRILERLGRGGMGSVYRAEQAGMNRVVALKILRRPFGQVEEHVERLRREARLVGALDHPNIVRGLDVGSHGPYHYFAMEFVEGETLRDLLKKRGIVPESEALRIVEQVCLALDHAHSRGIVHRDVKPGNIIVTPDGTPKLTDYGLAKGPADFTLTQSGVTIGTPQYISPEQAKDPVGVGIQTDLYSLGATAYHMLTGIPPHTSDTLAGLLTKVLYEKPRTARQVNPRVSAGASFLVEKMMAKQPRHRYREPREVLRDLRSLAAGRTIVPSNWAGDFEVHEARRRVRLIGAGAAAAVVLLAGATVWLQWRNQEQARRDREDGARGRYAILDAEGPPRSHEAWLNRLQALEEFLRDPANAETPAYEVAVGAREEAQEHVKAWGEARSVRETAAVAAQGLRFREAVEILRRELPTFEAEERRPFGREPAAWLREEIEAVRAAGRAEAAAAIAAALEKAAKSPAVEGMAERIQQQLTTARDRCRDVFLEGDARPLVPIEDVIGDIERARANVEQSRFGPGFRQSAALSLANGEFASLEQQIREAMDGMAQDAALQDLLARIPAPAAEDLRGRGTRELERARERNEAWIREESARAQGLADGGSFDAAVEILEAAEGRSMAGLREGVAVRRQEVVAKREESRRAGASRVRALFGAFFDDLLRRDFLVARRRVAEAAATATLPERPGIAVAANSAVRALGMVDDLCFAAVRRRLEGKGGATELQFVRDGKPGQRYRDASNVRVQDADTGPVIVFDEPGQPNLRGELHRLTLPLLLSLSGLDAGGLSNEQALVRALLVVTAPEGERIERRDLEAAAGQLRRVQDLVDQAGPVVEALLVRAEGLIDARIRADRNLEEEAAATYQKVVDAIAAKNPPDAIYGIQRLSSDAFKGTQFVATHRESIRSYAALAQAMLDDLRIEGLFPGARVEVLPAEPGAEARTRIRLDFDAEKQLQGLVRLEDPLYRIVVDPPVEGADGPRNGRLVLLEGGPGRDLADSPLTMECIFRTSKYMAVQFRWHPEDPLYLQVSLAGNHVGVLTDDGRKTSGRGVYAWQKEDWRGPDLNFPDSYRHDFLPKVPNLLAVRVEEGQKYFQFEKGESYLVRVEWDRPRLKLTVDGREIWNARMKYDSVRESPPRFRILSLTRGWIDDLSVEGVVDKDYLNRLLKRR